MSTERVDSPPSSSDKAGEPRPPSEEKTEVMVAPVDPAATPAPGDPEEVDKLRRELQERADGATRLEETVRELRAQIDALRGDYSAQSADEKLELRTLQELLERNRAEIDRLESDIDRQKRANKSLKSQNLRLQYHLNVWGIPVSAGGEEAVPSGEDDGNNSFFPKLSALVEGLDPIPCVLRGDVYTFGFPNLLHFLANSQLTGVLTMVTEGVVTKLYLEKGILRLAGWNQRNDELSLGTLLQRAELVQSSILERMRDDHKYDLGLAAGLLKEEELPATHVQSGLREHARVILTYLYQMEQGAFFFQPGILRRQRYLQFNLPILDLLLEAARELDHKVRDGQDEPAPGELAPAGSDAGR